MTRLLSPESMGAYFLILSLVSVLVLAAQLGLNQTVVRLVAESMGLGDTGRTRAAIRVTLIYGTIGGLVFAVLLLSGAGEWIALNVFKSPVMAGVIGLAALWIVLGTFQNLVAESFRGLHDIRFATIFSGLASGLIYTVIFFIIWAVYGYSDIKEILFVIILSLAISAVISGFILRGKASALGDSGEGDLKSKEVFAIAWPLLVTNLTIVILNQADLWVLGIFRSQDEVAVYGAVVRLVSIISMPLMVVNAVIPPIIAEYSAQRRTKELERLLRASATLVGLPSVAFMLMFLVFGEFFLGNIFGSYYIAGTTALSILCVGQMVNVWCGSCGFTLMMIGRQSLVMVITVASSALTVALCLLLVERHGATGVAIAATAGLTLQNILMWLGVKATAGIWTHMSMSVGHFVNSFMPLLEYLRRAR